MKKKRLRQFLVVIIGFLVLAFIVPGIIAFNQDKIVQELINQTNKSIGGVVALEDSHVSLVANFPYISIDLVNLILYDSKSDSSEIILSIEDTYIGFDALKLVFGDIEIKALSISGAKINLVQDSLGIYNVERLAGDSERSESGAANSSIAFGIDKISLRNVEFFKRNEYDELLIDLLIEQYTSSVRYSDEHIFMDVQTSGLLTVMNHGDTTFFHDKHLLLNTRLDYFEVDKKLTISPSTLKLENAEMTASGNVNLSNEANIDLEISGEKDNFDLLLAFAPPEIYPSFSGYENGGKIYFRSEIKGPISDGKNPSLKAEFGCEKAFIRNASADKSIKEMNFVGSFEARDLGNPSTMSFSLTDFQARPEAGTFVIDLNISDFQSPDIEVQLNSQFKLGFLIEFLEIKDLTDLSGEVDIKMNFHDIIDLENPEKSLNKLNESYFTQIHIKDLSFRSEDLPVPVENLNLLASIDGNRAAIDTLHLTAGSSDIRLSGSIGDLPSIIHHTDTPVDVNLAVKADTIDLRSLTRMDSMEVLVDEVITNFSTKLSFKASAKAFTESPHLPVGEFFVDELTADLLKYPHTLHDFTADILIDSSDFRVIDFSGMLDESDFHFDGVLTHYDLWFEDVPRGDTRIDFSITSSLLRLEDIFVYGGENHVPEDYRHEEFSGLKVEAYLEMHYDSVLSSTDLYIEDVITRMKVHPLVFRDITGRLHLEDQLLTVEGLGGSLGNSRIEVDYLANLDLDTTSWLDIRAERLDFDQLTNFNPPPPNYEATSDDHKNAFNIFDVPFPDMQVSAAIKKLNYHRYLIEDFLLEARLQKDHFIYIDSLGLRTAGGKITGAGYFNGSNPDLIYFSPDFTIENLALDKLLFKFENFGQEHLVSDNLVGALSAGINGKIHVYPDLMPILDDSELALSLLVTDGELIDFPVMMAMADFFKDRNLRRVRFDTLQNEFTLENGLLNIPRMNINTSIGFFELQGRQGTDLSMDYLVRVPWSMVTSAAKQKLFGKKKSKVDPDQIDEIQYRDADKNTRFLNVKVSGTVDSYEIKLGK